MTRKSLSRPFLFQIRATRPLHSLQSTEGVGMRADEVAVAMILDTTSSIDSIVTRQLCSARSIRLPKGDRDVRPGAVWIPGQGRPSQHLCFFRDDKVVRHLVFNDRFLARANCRSPAGRRPRVNRLRTASQSSVLNTPWPPSWVHHGGPQPPLQAKPRGGVAAIGGRHTRTQTAAFPPTPP
jgi:hypothetical protein